MLYDGITEGSCTSGYEQDFLAKHINKAIEIRTCVGRAQGQADATGRSLRTLENLESRGAKTELIEDLRPVS